MMEVDGELHMGYDFDWDVKGAMIIATPSDVDFLPSEGSDPT
jgi:hypothetical protein